MASNSVTVSVSVQTRWSRYWIKAMRLAAYVIGPERALSAAKWGGRRLIRIRLDNGPWRWLRD